MNNLATDLVIKERKCQLGSLHNWRYCVGARLKFWQRIRVPHCSWRLRRQISLDYYYNGSAAKSHSTTTQYRQLRWLQLGALCTASSNILCQTLVKPCSGWNGWPISLLFVRFLPLTFKQCWPFRLFRNQGSHSLEKFLKSIFPWKVLKFLCKSLKSPWIFFNFECSGLASSIFWCFLVVRDRIKIIAQRI